MMWTRQELKFRGKQALQRNYGAAVAVALIMGLVTGTFGADGFGVKKSYHYVTGSENQYFDTERFHVWNQHDGFGSTVMTGILSLIMAAIGLCIFLLIIFVGNVLEVGGKRFFILNGSSRPEMGEMLYGFKSGYYGNLVLTMFLRNLFIFLWGLLLIIPGIIKYYEYLMVPYILAENPSMDRQEAFLISKQMMDGQKMETFILDLSYLGWYILSGFTCGILGVFYVAPYVEATFAELYHVNKAEGYRQGYIR